MSIILNLKSELSVELEKVQSCPAPYDKRKLVNQTFIWGMR
jgi:hypothetical protein